MPTTPYASTRISVNGGATQTGAVAVAAGNTVQLSLASTVDVTACRWEIYAYPPGVTCPAGWSTGADGTYFSATVSPPAITVSSTWGKYLVRSIVNNGQLAPSDARVDATDLTDETTTFNVAHTSALPEVVPQETTQYNSKTWAADLRTTLRALISSYGVGTFNSITYTGSVGFTLAPAAAVSSPAEVLLKGASGSGSGGSGSITVQAGQVTSSGTPGAVRLKDANGIARVHVTNVGVGFNSVTPVAITSVTPSVASAPVGYNQTYEQSLADAITDLRNKLIVLGLANALPMPTIFLGVAIIPAKEDLPARLVTAAQVVQRLFASDELRDWRDGGTMVRLHSAMRVAMRSVVGAAVTAYENALASGFSDDARMDALAEALQGVPFQVSPEELALLRRVVDRAADPTAFADTTPAARLRGEELTSLCVVLSGLVTETDANASP